MNERDDRNNDDNYEDDGDDHVIAVAEPLLLFGPWRQRSRQDGRASV